MRSPIHGGGDEVASASSPLTDMELAATISVVLLVGWVLGELKAAARPVEPLPSTPRL
jgi:hypothetical protein